jgi:hypothetical protein
LLVHERFDVPGHNSAVVARRAVLPRLDLDETRRQSVLVAAIARLGLPIVDRI